MASRSAIAPLERRRTEILRRLRAMEAHIEQIRIVIGLLPGLEAELSERRAALQQLDDVILSLDPDWRPALPRGTPRGRRGTGS